MLLLARSVLLLARLPAGQSNAPLVLGCCSGFCRGGCCCLQDSLVCSTPNAYCGVCPQVLQLRYLCIFSSAGLHTTDVLCVSDTWGEVSSSCALHKNEAGVSVCRARAWRSTVPALCKCHQCAGLPLLVVSINITLRHNVVLRIYYYICLHPDCILLSALVRFASCACDDWRLAPDSCTLRLAQNAAGSGCLHAGGSVKVTNPYGSRIPNERGNCIAAHRDMEANAPTSTT